MLSANRATVARVGRVGRAAIAMAKASGPETVEVLVGDMASGM